MLYDFHTHTCISDGALSPLELVRRAIVNGYGAIAVTDHVGVGYLDRLISETAADCSLAQKCWDIMAIPGVELTHVPAVALAETAKRARELGAALVVVHGETPSEPVEPGTNLAAVKSPHVDILAHPGFLSREEAELAASNGIYLEVTTRGNHSSANSHVFEMARLTGAKVLINSDAHDELDLLTPELAYNTARGTGLVEAEIDAVLRANPTSLLQRLLTQ